MPLWGWVVLLGAVVAGAVIASREDDTDDNAASPTQPTASSGTTGAPAAAVVATGVPPEEQAAAAEPAAAGDSDEVDDVAPCALVNAETVTLDITNDSADMSNYIVDVNYLDGAGQRVADETFFVDHVRPNERAIDTTYASAASGAASCVIAEVDRMSGASPDDTTEVTCEMAGVDPIGDLAVTLTATNGSSGISDYLIAGAFMRDGVRIGTVDAVIENVPPGQSAPGTGLTTTDGPADGVTCDVVYVERTASS